MYEAFFLFFYSISNLIKGFRIVRTFRIENEIKRLFILFKKRKYITIGLNSSLNVWILTQNSIFFFKCVFTNFFENLENNEIFTFFKNWSKSRFWSILVSDSERESEIRVTGWICFGKLKKNKKFQLWYIVIYCDDISWYIAMIYRDILRWYIKAPSW